ncbi:Pentapeptide-repeat containing protein [Halomicronema hongdechloris C2206]|uniref:Pentapeptide-repeat containing protein n=1 Tax=Halomicronema hongdechloris C2206 TaxID=1641165 RepID=A0A1Z3HLB8_9CYAN|nr:hypothetical protein [Halomicronema hongdechloris]ASC71101.1 Pentapeptide-repeat containing protein [Halomicronema hongdechloris C2206]
MPSSWKRVLTLEKRPKPIGGWRIAIAVAIALVVILSSLAIGGIYLNGWPKWGIGEREITSTTTERDAEG